MFFSYLAKAFFVPLGPLAKASGNLKCRGTRAALFVTGFFPLDALVLHQHIPIAKFTRSGTLQLHWFCDLLKHRSACAKDDRGDDESIFVDQMSFR